MKVIVSATEGSLPKKVHLNLDGTHIELSELADVTGVVVTEKLGEIFVDTVVLEEVSSESESISSVEASTSELSSIVTNEGISFEVESEIDTLLFQKLSDLRRQLASEFKLPPYYIFHDKSLRQMATILPCDFEELKNVSGVGEAKLEKYGAKFISVIRDHMKSIA